MTPLQLARELVNDPEQTISEIERKLLSSQEKKEKTSPSSLDFSQLTDEATPNHKKIKFYSQDSVDRFKIDLSLDNGEEKEVGLHSKSQNVSRTLSFGDDNSSSFTNSFNIDDQKNQKKRKIFEIDETDEKMSENSESDDEIEILNINSNNNKTNHNSDNSAINGFNEDDDLLAIDNSDSSEQESDENNENNDQKKDEISSLIDNNTPFNEKTEISSTKKNQVIDLCFSPTKSSPNKDKISSPVVVDLTNSPQKKKQSPVYQEKTNGFSFECPVCFLCFDKSSVLQDHVIDCLENEKKSDLNEKFQGNFDFLEIEIEKEDLLVEKNQKTTQNILNTIENNNFGSSKQEDLDEDFLLNEMMMLEQEETEKQQKTEKKTENDNSNINDVFKILNDKIEKHSESVNKVNWSELQQELVHENSSLSRDFNSLQRQNTLITDEIIDDCKRLLDLFGLPYLQGKSNFLILFIFN